MNFNSLARQLTDKLKNGEGFSLDENGNPVTKGYAVGLGSSLNKALVTDVEYLTPENVEAFLTSAHEAFKGRVVIGGWVDNGKAYLEPSNVYNSLKWALAKGVERGELAIGDLAKYARGEDGTIRLAA